MTQTHTERGRQRQTQTETRTKRDSHTRRGRQTELLSHLKPPSSQLFDFARVQGGKKEQQQHNKKIAGPLEQVELRVLPFFQVSDMKEFVSVARRQLEFRADGEERCVEIMQRLHNFLCRFFSLPQRVCVRERASESETDRHTHTREREKAVAIAKGEQQQSSTGRMPSAATVEANNKEEEREEKREVFTCGQRCHSNTQTFAGLCE